MRKLIKDFVKRCSKILPIIQPVYEFGAFQVSGQEGFADLRPFFPDIEYIGADIREGPGVDVILDLHDIDLPSETAGTVLLLDTLEHVEFPRKAINNIHRILKANGLLIISSVMNFPIHDFPRDYWRFTPEAFKSLLSPFDITLVDHLGKSDFPHTIIGVGMKGKLPLSALEMFNAEIKIWKQEWDKRPPLKEKQFLKLFVPPIFGVIYRNIFMKNDVL